MPPNIPPLPQSHLQARTPDKGNAVARIISQFQEASNVSKVFIFALCVYITLFIILFAFKLFYFIILATG